ncbi:MAG: hypothetical protein JWQ35_1509 [Bacteriovoracaceae bacterium]|nr:hypothetical protein [Bacteriovoracaceae bacterium]
MARPQLQELTPDLQKIFDPEKAKMLPFIAKGAASLPPPVLVSSWCYLLEELNSELASVARNSLLHYPEKMLLPVLQSELPSWVLGTLGKIFLSNEIYLEAILLNEKTPNDLFVEAASHCSERISTIIVNNQERIIDRPDIIKSLETNPNNLKSNTDRLRHFMKLAGVRIPGEAMGEEVELMKEDEAALDKEFLDAIADGIDLAASATALTEDQRQSLLQFISKLTIGARIKLAMKGNKEARSVLIRDTNKLIALAVLKSPKITENEVAHYSALKSLPEDVVRVIANNPQWIKNYAIKIGLCFHPKTPLPNSVSLIKYLNIRDLMKLSKDRNVPGPLGKAAKQLLSTKRK